MNRSLLLGLCATTLLPFIETDAQNPVRDLKAEVKFNRYVNLTWQAPLSDEQRVVAEDNSVFPFWKNVDFSTKYSNTEIVQLDDKYLVSFCETETDVAHFETLDFDLNVVGDYSIPAEGVSTFGTIMIFPSGDDFYACNNGYRNTIYKFNLDNETVEKIGSTKKTYSLRGLVFIQELNDGNGGFVEVATESYSPTTYGTYYYDKQGNTLDGGQIKFSDIPIDEGANLNIRAFTYSNNKFFATGTKGVKNVSGREIYYIWEFDAEGNYVAERADLSDFVDSNFSVRNLFCISDSETGNDYIVVGATKINGEGQYYYTLLYFEMSKGGAVTGYDVFRNGEDVTDDAFSQTVFSDTLLLAGNYEYKVRAVYGSEVSDFETVNISIDEIGECASPENLKATIINKNNVALEWSRPVMENANVIRYHIYRGDEYVGESFSPVFVDNSVQPGVHSYSVTAEYDNSGVSEKTTVGNVEITGKMAMLPPRNFEAVSYIDADGIARIDLDWIEPLSGNGVALGYGDMIIGDVQNDNVAYGMAVKYDRELLSAMDGYSIDSVSFVVQCQGKYKIVIYEDGNSVCQQWIDSLSVDLGEINTFALETPVKLDIEKEYLVGIVCRPDKASFEEGNRCATTDNAILVDGKGCFVAAFEPSLKNETIYPYTDFIIPSNLKGHNNVKAHFSALDNSEIYEEGSGFNGYAVYRNGEKIEMTVMDETSFTDKGLQDGDYVYTVASTWNDSEDVHSTQLVRNVRTLYGAPDNLLASVDGAEVTLNWNTPLTGVPFVKRWDSGKNVGKLGNKSGGLLYAASLFTVDDLKSFGEFSITDVEFFPAEYLDFTIVIYSGEELIYSQFVDKSSLEVGDFNIVHLLEPVAIDGSKDLRVGYQVFNIYNGRPCGFDETESPDGKGNQLSMDGKTWASASEQGIPNNWNIAFTVQFFNNAGVQESRVASHRAMMPEEMVSLPAALNLSAEMTSSAQRSNLSGNTLAGYNVYRNGEKITASPVQNLTFSEVIAEGGDFEYYVGAVYTESEEMFSNRVSVSKTGVADVVSSAVAVYPNPATTEVHVSCGFDSYVVYDLSGRAVLRSDASGDVIGVGNLSSGQYLLVFAKDNMEYNRKITVVR